MGQNRPVKYVVIGTIIKQLVNGTVFAVIDNILLFNYFLTSNKSDFWKNRISGFVKFFAGRQPTIKSSTMLTVIVVPCHTFFLPVSFELAPKKKTYLISSNTLSK